MREFFSHPEWILCVWRNTFNFRFNFNFHRILFSACATSQTLFSSSIFVYLSSLFCVSPLFVSLVIECLLPWILSNLSPDCVPRAADTELFNDAAEILQYIPAIVDSLTSYEGCGPLIQKVNVSENKSMLFIISHARRDKVFLMHCQWTVLFIRRWITIH